MIYVHAALVTVAILLGCAGFMWLMLRTNWFAIAWLCVAGLLVLACIYMAVLTKLRAT